MQNRRLITTLSNLILCASAIWLTGCASIISGTKQKITFKSDPEGATITVAGNQIGQTPLIAEIKRKGGSKVATAEKEGYQKETFVLQSKQNGWFWGNFIFGGLLGSSTDSSTGAIHKYAKDMYFITLKPVGGAGLTPKSEVRAFVVANYKGIIEELHGKPGQNVKALLELMKMDPSKQTENLKLIKSLADSNKDIVDFANKLADLTP